jgi:mycofactocin system glycosyltransferase
MPTGFHCRLVAGVRIVRERGRGFLVSEQPLTVLEVADRGRRLLERARGATEFSDLSAAELRFLGRLRELGLVEFRPVAPETPPTVSVIVPVRDRERQLAGCLRSLERLHYPGDRLEVIVADDGSAVPVPAPAGVRVVRSQRPAGPAAARNLAASAAGGEVLAFLDSDCRAEPDWLEALLPEFADPEVAAVGGRVRAARERTWLERYDAVRSPLDLGRRYAQVRPRHPVSYLVTANLLVRRADFARVRGFDPDLRCGEDVDLAWRLVHAGRRVVYQPLGSVRHEHRSRPGEFLATRAGYAASEAALLRRHPGNGRFVGFSPGMAALLAGGLAALLGAPRALVAAAVLALTVEVGGAARTLQREGLPPGLALAATVRGQAWSLYYPARQLARYSLLPAVLLCLVAPRKRRARLLLGLGTAITAPSVADWYRLRPCLSLGGHVVAQLLDDVAYHAGTLRGCLRERTLAPLAARVRLAHSRKRRASESASS